MPNYLQDFIPDVVQNVDTNGTFHMASFLDDDDKDNKDEYVVRPDSMSVQELRTALLPPRCQNVLTCKNACTASIEKMMQALVWHDFDITALRIENSNGLNESTLASLLNCKVVQYSVRNVCLGKDAVVLDHRGLFIARALQQIPLNKLTLHRINFDFMYYFVATYIECNPTVEKLVLDDCFSRYALIHLIEDELCNVTRIGTLELNGSMVGGRVALALCDFIRDTRQIHSFILRDHAISDELLNTMLNAFAANEYVKQCSPITNGVVDERFATINLARYLAEPQINDDMT